MFKTFLEYKQLWSGGQVLFVDPKYTSQTCPVCQHKNKLSRKSQSKFECVLCGHEEHADVVGAKNILGRGHRLLACGETDVSLLSEAGTRQFSNELEPAVAKKLFRNHLPSGG